MISFLIFLYFSLMYSKYIFKEFGLNFKSNIISLGLTLGMFSIFLVYLLSPHNLFLIDNNYLILCNYFTSNNDYLFIKLFPISNYYYDILTNYIFTGLNEEVSKLLSALIIYKLYKRKDVHLYFYIVLAAVFFAFIENLGYFQRYGNSIVLIRSVLSNTAHISLGIINAFFFIYYLNTNRKVLIFYSLLLTTILHGSFNYSLYIGQSHINLIIWFIMILLSILSIKRVKKFFN